MQACRSLALLGFVSSPKWMDPQDADPLYYTCVGGRPFGSSGEIPACQRDRNRRRVLRKLLDQSWDRRIVGPVDINSAIRGGC